VLPWLIFYLAFLVVSCVLVVSLSYRLFLNYLENLDNCDRKFMCPMHYLESLYFKLSLNYEAKLKKIIYSPPPLS
jgi:hypothetical protein